jgi:hypothetical protein
MEKLFKLSLVFILTGFTLFKSQNVYAQANDSFMNPKLKAFLIVSGYGAALGGLLGVASLAFDAKDRAIAQGASLGLYAGIIFGLYIVNSYGKKDEPKPGLYQDAITPYGNDNIPPPDSPYTEENTGGGFFDSPGGFRIDPMDNFDQFKKKSNPNSLPIYLNLVNMTF